jgi:hypothetical protein
MNDIHHPHDTISDNCHFDGNLEMITIACNYILMNMTIIMTEY